MKTEIYLRIRAVWPDSLLSARGTLRLWLFKERPAKFQISLRACAGWLETSLGPHVGWYILLSWEHNGDSRHIWIINIILNLFSADNGLLMETFGNTEYRPTNNNWCQFQSLVNLLYWDWDLQTFEPCNEKNKTKKKKKKKKQLKMCQDDTDAPTQDHLHLHAGILQKIAIRWQIPRPHRKWSSFFSI